LPLRVAAAKRSKRGWISTGIDFTCFYIKKAAVGALLLKE